MALLKRIYARLFRTSRARNTVSRGCAEPPDQLARVPAALVAGRWDIKTQEQDLLITGQLEKDSGPVYLFFNKRLLGVAAPVGKPRKFRFLIQKAGGKGLAKGATFHLATPDGVVPHASGSDSWAAEGCFVSEAGFLDLDRQIDAGKRLTKKGTLVHADISDSVKQKYYQGYSRLSDWFGENFQYPVLVSHGTLLGLCRTGDLIPHDDDFDCCYLSNQTDVAAVVKERQDIMDSMRRAGFDFKVGVTGHIKVRWDKLTIDLMPAWIDNDVLYISGYSDIDGASSFVSPVSTLLWRSQGAVNTFAKPEYFLEAQYGPGWRTPDPGYRVKLSAQCKRNLKALQPPLDEAEEFGTAFLKKKLGIIAE